LFELGVILKLRTKSRKKLKEKHKIEDNKNQ